MDCRQNHLPSGFYPLITTNGTQSTITLALFDGGRDRGCGLGLHSLDPDGFSDPEQIGDPRFPLVGGA
jgi:hypothetical protein